MLGKRIVSPSLRRAPTYDTARPRTRCHSFTCTSCAAEIALDLAASLNASSGAEALLAAGDVEAIRTHFDFNLVGKSHDGGWPRLELTRCSACGAQYIVYLGVQEPANGRYLVTVEGITEWHPAAGSTKIANHEQRPMPRNEYKLFRGNTLLGVVEHTEDDMPWHIGILRATAEYSFVQALFEREAALVDEGSTMGSEWRAVRDEIDGQGLRLVDEFGHDIFTNPLLHIRGLDVWWR